MEFSMCSASPRPPAPAWSSSHGGRLGGFLVMHIGVTLMKRRRRKRWRVVMAADRNGGRGEAVEGGDREGGGGGGYGSPAMEVTTFSQSFSDTTNFPVWEKIGAIVRLGYGIGIYSAMALAGRFICSILGIDYSGGFDPSLDAIVNGLGYAAPPIMALLFILDDEVVKLSPYARAIRDVEDEELLNFFYGMSPWQFILIVAASSVGEELFYRAAIQNTRGSFSDLLA